MRYISKRMETNVCKPDSFLCEGKNQTNGSNFVFEAEGTDCFCGADVPLHKVSASPEVPVSQGFCPK